MNDKHWMRKALALARRERGGTAPNPPVGAILVCGGKEIASGSHRKAGGPHAEITALQSAGGKTKGATLYVSLEPCSSYGKTGPCTDAIIKSGIKRVVAAVMDPNPQNRGKGFKALKKAGLKVKKGVCAEEAEEIIAPFRKWVISGKPYLTLKLGMTLDGKIADGKKMSKWITCKESRAAVKALRRKVDGIIVGSGTARIDDPELLCGNNTRRTPFRIILDSAGKTPVTARVLNDKHVTRTIIAVTKRCSSRRRKVYIEKGATVLMTPQTAGHISLKALMNKLGKKGLLHVLCEGGGELAEGLIRAGLVDEYIFFIAPRIIGGADSVSAVRGKGWPLAMAPELNFAETARVGKDLMVRALPAT
ncbi:bifunctional diaminohydroxyphosphoribosylaminopyrimidine deaminase/5-amino-6-(5-phosphoribosylamino)uracil reductase RibD [Verrucomicrobiota bacterium]